METFFVIFSVSVVLAAFYLGTNDCKACRNEPTHIFNLSEHQSLNFGGVVLSRNSFQVTPISNEEFGVVFSAHCGLGESHKIIRSFYTNVKNFGKVETENINFFMLDGYLKSQRCPSFFYGESNGKAYTVCQLIHDVYVQICDLKKIQTALVEYNEIKTQKEREWQEKLEKEAQIFPF